MAKNKEVAYVPLNNSGNIKQEVEKVDTADLVNYKEQGVEFQKYSKVKIGNNQYKIFRQEYNNAGSRFGWGASNAELSLSINPNYLTKNFYITNMIIEGFSDTDCYFALGQQTGLGGSAKVDFRLICLAGAGKQQQNIEFKVPFPFSGNTIFIQPLNLGSGTPIAITGRCFIEYFGYLEDKS